MNLTTLLTCTQSQTLIVSAHLNYQCDSPRRSTCHSNGRPVWLVQRTLEKFPLNILSAPHDPPGTGQVLRVQFTVRTLKSAS